MSAHLHLSTEWMHLPRMESFVKNGTPRRSQNGHSAEHGMKSAMNMFFSKNSVSKSPSAKSVWTFFFGAGPPPTLIHRQAAQATQQKGCMHALLLRGKAPSPIDQQQWPASCNHARPTAAGRRAEDTAYAFQL
ncbi:hypothetical protein M409DRAFT_49442 [Zasmidium cellare ATCC 36951]|uniref:Uncharacterized protein n=1 Tax=Zasmidium cellare ATCC 36951 TaxID=1080233 RepID=A0A6A6D185_ZASCE|nr:uncharacterized protein M409DRAFT_49442 [Zasmidium cellare ATCC 36951]KAF2172935.1 hypothetical protein M409DRAFT_49442 [Zasmidium cellare ATCC 36951]